MWKIVVGFMAAALTTWAAGCGSDDGDKSSSDQVGSMEVKAGGPSGTQLTGTIAARDVFDPTHILVAECMEKTYPLPGDGSFCDNLLVLPPGLYEVIVQPDDPNCRTEQPWYKVPVQPNQTTEIEIKILCGAPTGGLDVIVTEGWAPVIVDIDFTFPNGSPANKFVCAGGPAVTITVTVIDRDTPCSCLVAGWVAMLNGVDKTACLFTGTPLDPECHFTRVINTATQPGTYDVTFWVRDPEGHTASITFPIHLIPCPPH